MPVNGILAPNVLGCFLFLGSDSGVVDVLLVVAPILTLFL